MKKTFEEPKLLVENFAIKELRIANCAVPENIVNVSHQASDRGCYNGTEEGVFRPVGTEDKRRYYDTVTLPNGNVQYVTDIYGNVSSYWDGDVDDLDKDGNTVETIFSKPVATTGVCQMIPSENGVYFNSSLQCSDGNQVVVGS